ncbi:MAG: thiamine phosphate synthase [Terriglobia bacterium]
MHFSTLCYITDRRGLHRYPLSGFLVRAVEAGIGMIQIREKDLETRALCELAELAVASARKGASLIVINDRLDIALASGASGVHLGSHSLTASAARSIAPEGFLVGVSCHSLDQARAAESMGADYLLLGPIFETPSKLAFGPPLGEAKLKKVIEEVKVPVLALGGITPERIPACIEAGASGIAGIRIFQEAPTLSERVKQLSGYFSRKGV